MKRILIIGLLACLLLSACALSAEMPKETPSPAEEALAAEVALLQEQLAKSVEEKQATENDLAALRVALSHWQTKYDDLKTTMEDQEQLYAAVSAGNDALLAALQQEYAALANQPVVNGAAEALAEKFRRGDLRETVEKGIISLLASHTTDRGTLFYITEWEHPAWVPALDAEYGMMLAAHQYNLVRDNLTLVAQAMHEKGAASFQLVFRGHHRVAMLFQVRPTIFIENTPDTAPYAQVFLYDDPFVLGFFAEYTGLDGKTEGIHQKP